MSNYCKHENQICNAFHNRQNFKVGRLNNQCHSQLVFRNYFKQKMIFLNIIQRMERKTIKLIIQQGNLMYTRIFLTHIKNDIALDLNLFQPLRPYLFPSFIQSPYSISFFILQAFGTKTDILFISNQIEANKIGHVRLLQHEKRKVQNYVVVFYQH